MKKQKLKREKNRAQKRKLHGISRHALGSEVTTVRYEVELDMVADAGNPSTHAVEPGGLRVLGQPGQHGDALL